MVFGPVFTCWVSNKEKNGAWRLFGEGVCLMIKMPIWLEGCELVFVCSQILRGLPTYLPQHRRLGFSPFHLEPMRFWSRCSRTASRLISIFCKVLVKKCATLTSFSSSKSFSFKMLFFMVNWSSICMSIILCSHCRRKMTSCTSL